MYVKETKECHMEFISLPIETKPLNLLTGYQMTQVKHCYQPRQELSTIWCTSIYVNPVALLSMLYMFFKWQLYCGLLWSS